MNKSELRKTHALVVEHLDALDRHAHGLGHEAGKQITGDTPIVVTMLRLHGQFSELVGNAARRREKV